MASDIVDSGQPSKSDIQKESIVASGYQAATSTLQGLGGTVYGLFSRGLGYKQDKSEAETSDKDSGGNMAASSKQTGKSGTEMSVLLSSSQTRFDTTDADDGFLNVDVKDPSVSQIDPEEDDDDTSALGRALEENDKLHQKQASNLRKIAELEKRLKHKVAEMQAMKQQVSSAPQKPTSVAYKPRAETVESESVKEKDKRIRYLERQLDQAKHLEARVIQLTMELSQKDEQVHQLTKCVGKDTKGQVQETMAQQCIQELTADVEKWSAHSKNQSRQVLSLRQEVDGQKLQFKERIQSMEGLLEGSEREKQQFFEQSKILRAERDELQGTKEQLEKEILIMKQQEMDTMQKYRLLEMDETTCPKRGCKESRKEYSKLAAENAQLQKSLASVGRISEQQSASAKAFTEQKRFIADLKEKVEIAQTQAASNKADFEEERSDRMKAHSKFADLETQAAKTKSHFEQKRATYEHRIASLQQDLSAVKLQLKTHVQELVHFEEYGKRKEDQVKELTEDKLKLNNKLAKMKAKAESMIRQYRKENEQLKAQLSQATTSMVSMSEEMKGKKGKKKISEDISKALKKFKKAVSTKPIERSGEPMECELTEAQGVIDMLCETIDEKEEELRQLRVANREMSKTLTAGPKAMKKFSYDQSQTNTEDDQPSEDSEALFFLPATYNEGRSHTEEHTAGTGHMATVLKQTSVTASTDFPSTFATQDQLSPLHPSGTHSSTGGASYKGDYRRGSAPTMGIRMASSPSDAYSQSSSSAVSMKDKQLPLRALAPPPPVVRYHSNPGPQQSSSREPVRAVAPTPSTTNQTDPCPQQPSTKQPLRALAPPPSVTNQSVPGFQPFPVRIRQTDGTVPQQQQIDNLQPGIRYPPKMHSEKQQRELETKQNVNPRPVCSQPQPQQMQQQQSNVQAHSNQQQLGQPHHQMRNVQPHGGYPQGTVQPPQGRPYSDHQQYTAGSDAMHQPESHTPHSHPLAGKHSGGMPAAKPRTNVPGGGPSQAEYQQPLPPQEAQNRKDHILSHAAPEYKQPSHMSGRTLNTLSKQASHDNQPAGSVPSNAYQAVAGNASQQPSPSQAAIYVNFGVLQQNQPPQSAGLSQCQQNFESQASSTSTTAAPNAQQSYGHRKVPQGERQKRMISKLPPLESLMADQHSNKLSTNINDDIGDVAAEVREQVSGSRERTVTNTERPFDPNLVCPMCNKAFRIGEIQKFRAHVNSCEGTKGGLDHDEGTIV